jgi:hypothetical protein
MREGLDDRGWTVPKGVRYRTGEILDPKGPDSNIVGL